MPGKEPCTGRRVGPEGSRDPDPSRESVIEKFCVVERGAEAREVRIRREDSCMKERSVVAEALREGVSSKKLCQARIIWAGKARMGWWPVFKDDIV